MLKTTFALLAFSSALTGCVVPKGKCVSEDADGTLIIDLSCNDPDTGDSTIIDTNSGDTDTDSETDSDSDTDSDTDTDTDTDSDSDTDSDTDSNLDSDSDSADTDTDTDTDSDSDSDSNVDTDTDTAVDSNSDSDSASDSGDSTNPSDSNGDTSDSGDTAIVIIIDVDGDGDPSGTDCDDADATINHGAIETCDGVDNNCDGAVDEGVESDFYSDSDSDGYGDGSLTVTACSAPAGYVTDATDCDDTDATIYPSAPETCTDTADKNCDGSVGAVDADGDGSVACLDCDDTNASAFPGNGEVCDSVDNDCNGTVDDEPSDGITYYADNDNDGYGDASSDTIACSEPANSVTDNTDCNDADNDMYPGDWEWCDGKDNDCDGTADNGDHDGDGSQVCDDCDDADALAFPGNVEACDSADNDCNGLVDDGITGTWYTDSDSDSYGDASTATSTCAPSGDQVSNGDDCDDTNASTNPGAAEVCDDMDNNCDTTIDEGVLSTFYADSDGDGYGDVAITTEDCSAPAGYVADATDCDETRSSVNPAATESEYNGLDDDCDGNQDLSDNSYAITTGANLFISTAKWDMESAIGVGDVSNFALVLGAAAMSDCTTAFTDSCSVKFQGPGSWIVTSNDSATAGSNLYCFFSAKSSSASTSLYAGEFVGGASLTASTTTVGTSWATVTAYTSPTAPPESSGTVQMQFTLTGSDTVWIDAIVCQQ